MRRAALRSGAPRLLPPKEGSRIHPELTEGLNRLCPTTRSAGSRSSERPADLVSIPWKQISRNPGAGWHLWVPLAVRCNLADQEKSPAFSAALANEQFILQSVSSTTVSESSSRAALYFSALSSGLVAVGFASSSPATISALLFTIFPTVFLLGWFTIVRLIDTSVENLVAVRRIEAIRRHWASLDPDGPKFFRPDDPAAGHRGVRYGFWSLLFTMASVVVFVNSVLGGATVALVCAIPLRLPVALDVAGGVIAGLASVSLGLRYEHRRITGLILGQICPTTADGTD